MKLPLNQVLLGDCLDVMRTLPDGCIDVTVTSPPYLQLRSYLPADDPLKALEMGSEPTIAEFVDRLVGVLREVRRVLKPTGVCFINIADSYASGKGSCHNPGGGADSLGQDKRAAGAHPLNRGNKSDLTRQGLQPKSLMLIPERLLLALQLDGWIVRDRIMWVKGREYADDDLGLNPMPGSQKDRCTNAHEFIFHLTKPTPTLYWTHERTGRACSVKPEPDYIWIHKETKQETVEPQTGKEWTCRNLWRGHDSYFDWQAIAEPPRGDGKVSTLAGWDTASRSHGTVHKSGRNAADAPAAKGCDSTPLVMPRNVWIFPTKGYKGAFYASYPPELPRRCIKVGSSAHGCCSACGKPWVRVSSQTLVPGAKACKANTYDERDATGAETDDQGSKRDRDGHVKGCHYEIEQQGWQPTCDCNAAVSPSVILDCFMGSGTTAAAAQELGRNWIGIDLDARNLALIEERLAAVKAKEPDCPLFSK
jgi:DNA modification methylase